MFEWRKIWPNGLPDEGQSPKPGHRMAEEGIPFPWRWYGGTISTNLDVIWGMSVESYIGKFSLRNTCSEGGHDEIFF